MDLLSLRHSKESTYFAVAAVISAIIWCFLIWFVWPFIIVFGIISLIMGQYFRAIIYGNTVKVTPNQFRQINVIVAQCANSLQINQWPEVFILSGQGVLNALAVRFLTGKYVLLYGELLDLMLQRGEVDEVKMIIGHELAHHALGHVSIWKNLLLLPSRSIPFLGAAYGRACELSADRIGMVLSGNTESAQRALLAMTLGSEALAGQVNIEAFREQENDIPPIMGFFNEIYSTHPRMTRRISELIQYDRYLPRQSNSTSNRDIGSMG